MKLLVFCPYYPPHIGGLETHAAEFNLHMADDDLVEGITVFTPHLPLSAPAEETMHKGKVKIIRYPAFEIVPNYPLPKFWQGLFWRQWRALARSPWDIVISRTRFFNTSLLALIFAKRRKVKLVHIEHGSDFVQLSSSVSTRLAYWYDLLLGRLSFRFSDTNIAISQAVARFIRRFDSRTLPIIYRGVELDTIASITPDADLPQRYKGKIIITVVGRLYKWKGIANSIAAIQLLPRQLREKVVFLIVGDGEDFSRLQKLAASPVYLLGKRPRNDAIAIVKASDIYIHSSYPGGGLSTSLLEAMACGCAVIATPHEGADEVIRQDNGILITDSQPELIRDALVALIEDKAARRTLGAAAERTVREKFSWEKSVAEYKRIFRRLLAHE